ncbi:hypothetical protein CAMRE0001_2482 [Campylobacter rectus RM3267]|uniref:Uncharacterized protein n=1 Tax=Campylobacter rectus RM3267 TaxID=553218 RepID=B9D5B8_CAMRE|nr:hypothetical protein CAMRE0001_2482 [Campylobacter rectus RM3267]
MREKIHPFSYLLNLQSRFAAFYNLNFNEQKAFASKFRAKRH